RLRALGVEGGEDPVDAARAVGHDLAGAPAGRGERPLGHRSGASAAALGAAGASAWSSCRQRGEGRRSRSACTARAAAEAPVMVVMHAMPWRTAAVRIS